MQEHRTAVLKRLEQALEMTGMNATALAKAAGLAHTTLTRFLKDPAHANPLTTSTLAKIDALVARVVAARQAEGGTAIARIDLAENAIQGPDEIRLLQVWRRLADKDKMVVLRLIETLFEESPTSEVGHKNTSNSIRS